MFHDIKLAPRVPGPASTRLRVFCAALGTDLLAAAITLGGGSAERRVRDLFEGLQTATYSDRQIFSDLRWVLSLLALEGVDDLESLEAAHFTLLDPDSDEVMALCELHNTLKDFLDSVSERG